MWALWTLLFLSAGYEKSTAESLQVKQLFRSVLSEIYAKEDLWRPPRFHLGGSPKQGDLLF